MSFIWTLLGTLGQMTLAGFLLLFVVFSAGSIANQRHPSALVLALLDASVYVLPGSCLASAIWVIYLHRQGAGAAAYGWYAVPVALAAAYAVFAVLLSQR